MCLFRHYWISMVSRTLTTSLDVEGGEAAVLDSIDFDKVTIDVMTIEDHWDNETIHKCVEKLTKLGYRQVTRLGHDIVLSRIPELNRQ